jgi:hypothetical protein
VAAVVGQPPQRAALVELAAAVLAGIFQDRLLLLSLGQQILVVAVAVGEAQTMLLQMAVQA